MFTKSLAAAAILGFSFADAHMLMTNPVPYNKDAVDSSPLSNDGSDFPCQNVGYTVTTENHVTKGQPFNVEFQGSATHGGGSCQFSITSDRAPTKDTKWSVIKSIEGGCMDESEGNENQNGGSAMKNSFSPSITIPDSFEDGQYTFAWTWINRIGNREFYMNCAPITLSGGSLKRSDVAVAEKRTEHYPDMFIANINGCKTKENYSPRYPYPGSNLISFSEAHLIGADENVCDMGTSPTWGTAGFSSGGSSAEPTLGGDYTGASSTLAAPTEPAPTEATPATTEGATPSVSIGGAVAVPNFTGEPAAAQTTEPAASVPTPSSTFVSVAVPTAAPTSSPSTTSTAGALSGSCTDDGAWNCVGGSSFQRCASGTWTDVQILASGTECTPGQNMNFAVKAVQVKSRMLKEKRSRRRAHGHINIHS
ncbi:hypothetical protein BDW68DRAFT_165752 [Aspergillus falconensis]